MILRCLTDEALCARAQNGDRDAADVLLRRYDDLICALASRFYLPGGDREDIEQEARCGFLTAIRTFDSFNGAQFRTLAFLAVRRRLMTAVKNAHRGKHRVLDQAVRIARSEDGEPEQAIDYLAAPRSDPQTLLEAREELARLIRGMRSLTPTERHWLLYAIDGGLYSSRVAGRRNKRAGERRRPGTRETQERGMTRPASEASAHVRRPLPDCATPIRRGHRNRRRTR